MSPITGRLKPQWFHILLALSDKALHGTAIMAEVLERTEGSVKLWPGSLYGSLEQIAEGGLIAEVDAPMGAPTEGGKRRFYQITPKGREVLMEEVDRLAAIVEVARLNHLQRDRGSA